MPMYSFTLIDRVSGDVFTDVVGDSRPGVSSSEEVQGLVSTLMTYRAVVIIGLEQLMP